MTSTRSVALPCGMAIALLLRGSGIGDRQGRAVAPSPDEEGAAIGLCANVSAWATPGAVPAGAEVGEVREDTDNGGALDPDPVVP